MDNEDRDMILFLLIAFVLPFLSILLQLTVNNTSIKFVLYGMEAASPTIAAIIMICMKRRVKKLFRKKTY